MTELLLWLAVILLSAIAFMLAVVIASLTVLSDEVDSVQSELRWIKVALNHEASDLLKRERRINHVKPLDTDPRDTRRDSPNP